MGSLRAPGGPAFLVRILAESHLKRLLVIGATSAIAHAAARRFAADGATFALVARDPAKLQAAANDLEVRGGQVVHTETCDLRDLERHPALVERSLAALGHADAALVAHGATPDQAACERDSRLAADAILVNCTSAVSLVTLLAAHFERERRGCIAVITSVAGDRGRRSNYVYGAAKAGLSAFLEGLRARMAPSGVRVVDVKPGWVDTPMTAGMKKNPLFAGPRRVGNAIYRAMRRANGVVYVPWFWRPIMFIVRRVPGPLLQRLSLPGPP